MKKTLILLLLFISGALNINAQGSLPTVYLPENLTIHFISPEPIQYVDISSSHIAGDLPLKNVLRIRYRDTLSSDDDAVITITGEKYIAQYHIICGGTNVPTEIEIKPGDTKPLDISGIDLSVNQLKALALNIASQKQGKKKEKVKAFGIRGMVNHIYTFGDYIFMDIGYENRTNLKYDIEALRWTIEDKKVTKASNVQSVEIKPEFVLFSENAFKKQYRNIFVFKKITYPGNKVLHVELNEKHLSGRVINLQIPYQDILEADMLSLK
jgi:conjugative transposon TraN protein